MNPGTSPGQAGQSGQPVHEERSLARDALIRLAVALLRPVIRILLRYNLSYPEMNQICRWLYVDVCMREREFYIPRRKRQFKARVACLTGLSRKEVLRLHNSPPPEANPELESCNRAARVLAGWMTDPAYRDASGQLARLDFRSDSSAQSFAELVQAYSGDIPPRAVLDELLRAGNCEMDASGVIRVINPVYLTRPVAAAALLVAAERGNSILTDIDESLRSAALPASRTSKGEIPEDAESGKLAATA